MKDIDQFRWLEEVEGESALKWVREQNESVLAKAEGSPGYDQLFKDLREVFDDSERIAFPRIHGDAVYNFWQDADGPRGRMRRASLESYLAGSPSWETILDIDRLAEEEGENWTYQGQVRLDPEQRYSLISLSRGGSDASVIREFDLQRGEFVEDGFFVPEAKSQSAWIDRDHILIGTDFGEGSLTTSGYPRTLRLWKRGTKLEDAPVVFEGDVSDVSLRCHSETHGTGRRVFVTRAITFYTNEKYLFDDGEMKRLHFPEDAYFSTFKDQVILNLNSDWTVDGSTYRAGSLVSTDIEGILSGTIIIRPLYSPTERSTIQNWVTCQDALYLNTLENVRGRIYSYRFDEGSWQGERVDLPELGSVAIISGDDLSDKVFLGYSDFLTPTTLYYFDPADSSKVREIARQPSYFDSSGLIVEQKETTSKDGTSIPYFIVRPAEMVYDGTAPTILYGYGGFRVSQTPSYSGGIGRAWLARGGVYVVANLRGGGEFGPEWHAAALKENRWRSYEDYIAVAEDLIESGVTSPKHLGIMGGSNGGLLVGVAYTHRPDLFNAVACLVPLLDMRHYHTMLAGASWMAEYGNPDLPEEWEYIQTYSPYHNLKENETYPEVLFITSTKDDRVHPGHARKMAALMKEMGHPYYYFENMEGGHAAGVNNEQIARRTALTFTYFAWKLMGETE